MYMTESRHAQNNLGKKKKKNRESLGPQASLWRESYLEEEKFGVSRQLSAFATYVCVFPLSAKLTA